MENIDRDMERRVWERVYANTEVSPVRRQRQPREALRRCYERAMANVKFYESRSRDPIYGPAYTHLARQTQEECKMLQQIMKG